MAQKTFQDNNQESNGSNEEFDDKFEDLKERKKRRKEEVNQNLSTNKRDKVDLNMDSEQGSDDKILSFGWDLRNDIISHVMKLIALLDGICFEANDRKNLLTTNSDLIKRLSFLSFNGNTSEYKTNLSLIDGDLLDYLNHNKSGLFYELKNSARKDMVDLLMQNTNFILMDDSNQNDLLLRNNNLMHLLINLNKSRFSENSDLVKSIKIEGKNGDEEAKVEATNLKKEIELIKLITEFKANKLKEEIEALKLMTERVTFDFDIRGIDNFLKRKEIVFSETFPCSSVKWHLSAKVYNRDGEEYIGVYLNPIQLETDCSIKTSYDFILIHPTDHQLNISKVIKSYIFNDCTGYGTPSFVKVKDLNSFMHENLNSLFHEKKIKIRCYLRADKMILWK